MISHCLLVGISVHHRTLTDTDMRKIPIGILHSIGEQKMIIDARHHSRATIEFFLCRFWCAGHSTPPFSAV
jgi:hypothetical protein